MREYANLGERIGIFAAEEISQGTLKAALSIGISKVFPLPSSQSYVIQVAPCEKCFLVVSR
jgi:hypothetical protein